ncbi:glycogen debranching protein GlgX [Ruminococcus gauvreauii]|uniref:Glycogen debranching protein GlgX n=1 Tax=Ruminococcus gauvreauii TaxID=438033 RepID=A0ABY5VFB4_9FIRM|nr:glycogen debranching protein GlgX [Ruminococcus gauvreauii]UWP59089.1 glycogen debranching protein GlgX [Ruminococcus gauvreauii]
MVEKLVDKRVEGIRRLLKPLDHVGGYGIRPGMYLVQGALALPGGVSFTIHSLGAYSCELALFHRGQKEPYTVIPFPEEYRIGDTYSMIVFGLDIEENEYAFRFDGPYDPGKGLLFDKERYLLDPYARAVVGQSKWGEKTENYLTYRARVVEERFSWGKSTSPDIPFTDLIIYELHVRGFTKHPSSGVKCPGTFEGLREKIPYLKELGVNAVELMPVFEFDEMEEMRVVDGEILYNYWGYNPVCFFAPNTSYASAVEYNREGSELKTLIRELNENGIEVILDVVFNHTAEGNQDGPCFSLKGIDNNVYYMLTPDGDYYNFSGCGNTLNCNHPVVQQMILDCLRYWVIEYHVSGFRFDLASILGRSEDGTPLRRPPLLESLSADPILSRVKLIAEAWDAAGLYQVGSFPSFGRWAEWNGKYRDDIRSFLKGDGGMAANAAQRMIGSPDLYRSLEREDQASVNFITCHDGFTLYDLYAYNEKHNEKNGWNNTDGDADNRSWNCGAEGETDDPEILRLRKRLRKNAYAVLMCSRGAVMVRAGDEFGNTQYGNNNAYCQDNEISWLDWNNLKTEREMFTFCSWMNAFRMRHPVLRRKTKCALCGLPDVSFHSGIPWNDQFDGNTRLLGVLYAGRDESDSRDDLVFVAVNAYWEPLEFWLPYPAAGRFRWKLNVDTGSEDSIREVILNKADAVTIGGRSVMIFTAGE